MVRQKWLQLRRGVAKHGPRQALLIVSKRLGSGIRRRWRRRYELIFDRARGIDTTGLGAIPEGGDAVRYQATMPKRFLRLMRALEIEPSLFTFVDLGCGKGRTLILAAELGFRRVIGVEFESHLAEAAKRNAEAIGAAAEIYDLDASLYAFPSEPLIVYLYNPFLDTTMQRVLANLRASLETSPRPVYVVYYNPVLAELLDHQPFLVRVRSERDAAIYRVRA